jgi:hypothetical protein
MTYSALHCNRPTYAMQIRIMVPVVFDIIESYLIADETKLI